MSANAVKVEDVIRQASDWNFAGDSALLQWMKQISQDVERRANQSCEALRKLDRNVKTTSTALENVANSLSALQFGDQFVESRVQDDDEIMIRASKLSPSLPKDQVNTHFTKETFDQFLNNNLKMLYSCHEKYSLDLEDSDNDMGENGVNNTYIYQPINPYSEKALPHIFGSKQWRDHWHVGLCETQSSEFSGDDMSDEFSEVSASDENESFESNTPNISQWTSSCSLQNETLRTKIEVKNASSLKGLQALIPNESNTVQNRVKSKETSSINSESLKNTLSVPSNPSLFNDVRFDNQIKTASQHPNANHAGSITNDVAKPAPKQGVGFIDLFAETEEINAKNSSSLDHQIKHNSVNLFDDDDDDFQSYMNEVAKEAPSTFKSEVIDVTVAKHEKYATESEDNRKSSLKTNFLKKSLFDDDIDEVDDFLNMFGNKKSDTIVTKTLTQSLVFDDEDLNLPLEKNAAKVDLFKDDNDAISEENIRDTSVFASLKESSHDSSVYEIIKQDSSTSKSSSSAGISYNTFNDLNEDEDLSGDLFGKSSSILDKAFDPRLSPEKVLSEKNSIKEKFIEKTIEKTISNNQKSNDRENISESLKSENQSNTSSLNYTKPNDNPDRNEDFLIVTPKISANFESESKAHQPDKITSQVNNYNFNASLFLQEPPDDSDYFDSFRKSPPITTFKHNSSTDLIDDFYEHELPNSSIFQEQVPKTIKPEKCNNVYNAIQCFSDVPPEDEGDNFVNTSQTSRTLSNIFYDDLNETQRAVDENRDHTASIHNTINDKKFKKVDIDFWETEGNALKEPEFNAQKFKPSKLEVPNIHINVKALLPGSSYRKPTDLKEVQHLDQLAEASNDSNDTNRHNWEEESKETNGRLTQTFEKTTIDLAFHNTKINLDKDEQLSNNQYLLPSINKTRIRAPVSRKPSTRKARQESYRKSLQTEQEDFNEYAISIESWEKDETNNEIVLITSEERSQFSEAKIIKLDERRDNDFESPYVSNSSEGFGYRNAKRRDSLLKIHEQSPDLYENIFVDKIYSNNLISSDSLLPGKESISINDCKNDSLNRDVVVENPIAIAKNEVQQKSHQQVKQSKPIPTKSTNLFDDSESDDDFFTNTKKTFVSSKSRTSTVNQASGSNVNVKITEDWSDDDDQKKISLTKSELTSAQNKNKSSLFDDDSEDDLLFKTDPTKLSLKQKSQNLFANDDDGDDDDDLFFETNQAKPLGRPKSQNLFDNDSDIDDDEADLFNSTSSRNKPHSKSEIPAAVETKNRVSSSKTTTDNPLADLL